MRPGTTTTFRSSRALYVVVAFAIVSSACSGGGVESIDGGELTDPMGLAAMWTVTAAAPDHPRLLALGEPVGENPRTTTIGNGARVEMILPARDCAEAPSATLSAAGERLSIELALADTDNPCPDVEAWIIDLSLKKAYNPIEYSWN